MRYLINRHVFMRAVFDAKPFEFGREAKEL
jgi:hypothetical protein